WLVVLVPRAGARGFGLGRALGREAPEFDGAGLAILLGGLEAEPAQDGGEVCGGAADLGGEFGGHGEGRSLRVAAELRERVHQALGEIGADGARADAEIAGGPQHGLGPGVFGEREGGLRWRLLWRQAGMDGA